MITVPSKKVLDQLPSKKHNGDVALCEDTKAIYLYKDGEWLKQDSSSGGLNMSLYEINKSVLAGMNKLTKKEIYQKREGIKNWFTAKKDTGATHFMLLCRDINYYTVFYYNAEGENSFDKEVILCAQDIGDIMAIDATTDEMAFEIWVKTQENEILCMQLFDYTTGTIGVK